jgi:hypothetical protein
VGVLVIVGPLNFNSMSFMAQYAFMVCFT